LLSSAHVWRSSSLPARAVPHTLPPRLKAAPSSTAKSRWERAWVTVEEAICAYRLLSGPFLIDADKAKVRPERKPTPAVKAGVSLLLVTSRRCKLLTRAYVTGTSQPLCCSSTLAQSTLIGHTARAGLASACRRGVDDRGSRLS